MAGPYRTFVGKQVVVGVRPEDIHDPHFVPPGITTSLAEAEVELTELMGAEIYVYYKSGDKNFMARVDPRTRARMGDRLEVSFDIARSTSSTGIPRSRSADPVRSENTFPRRTFGAGFYAASNGGN